jgi:hypothetical protein
MNGDPGYHAKWHWYEYGRAGDVLFVVADW